MKSFLLWASYFASVQDMLIIYSFVCKYYVDEIIKQCLETNKKLDSE